MFRANRIGTPVIHADALATSTDASTSINTNTLITPSYQGVIVNSVPIADFGRGALYWAPSSARTIAADSKGIIALQFTVTEPIQGDAVGVEINASVRSDLRLATQIVPVMGRMTAEVGATLATFTATSLTALNQPPIQGDYIETDTSRPRGCTVQSQVVLRAGNAPNIAGTYFAGFLIQTGASADSFAWLQFEASIRQLNDQQNVGYRDTRR